MNDLLFKQGKFRPKVNQYRYLFFSKFAILKKYTIKYSKVYFDCQNIKLSHLNISKM